MPAPAAKSAAAPHPTTLPPRERILAVARELFYRRGIHAVGVDAIAEAAGTNKMTLYRHFTSKDELIAACLRELVREIDADWEAIAAAHPGDPRGQLLAWLQHLSEWLAREAGRGCALANAAVELPDNGHPARLVVRQHKSSARQRLADLCRDAELNGPEGFAAEAFLLCEGARIASQSLESDEPLTRLPVLLNDLVEQHSQSPRAPLARQAGTRQRSQ
jgi:AcrR family transcriptional regulator